MTKIVAHRDAYLRELDSTVVSVRPGGLVLDSTVFYPGGGGQPPDTGVLISGDAEYPVSGVKRIDGALVHVITDDTGEQKSTDDKPLTTGAMVHGVVDRPRRYQLMRTHTALHIC